MKKLIRYRSGSLGRSSDYPRMDRFTYYAVTDNGTRFLITEANPPNGIVALTLVTNWDGGGRS